MTFQKLIDIWIGVFIFVFLLITLQTITERFERLWYAPWIWFVLSIAYLAFWIWSNWDVDKSSPNDYFKILKRLIALHAFVLPSSLLGATQSYDFFQVSSIDFLSISLIPLLALQIVFFLFQKRSKNKSNIVNTKGNVLTKTELQGLRNQWIELIGENKVSLVLKNIESFHKEHEMKIPKELNLLKSRQKALNDKEAAGILSSTEFTIQRNKITHALINFIDDFTEELGD